MANIFALLLPLLLAHVALPSSALNIDCGGTSSTDENSLIWDPDDDYIQTGENRKVQNPGSVSEVLSTLRVFTTRKKNCYLIPVEKQVQQILVRAGFYYGNYDGRSSPPTFDLQFDGNHWRTVTTSSNGTIYGEAIYFVSGDATSVCVAQTEPGQFPFISSLEVNGLESSMYSRRDSNLALFLIGRIAYGAQEIVRYPTDIYDRIWNPSITSTGITVLAGGNFPLVGAASNMTDIPPSAVLQSAVTPTDPTQSLILIDNLQTGYVNMYFAEVSLLNSTDNRAFEIYVNRVSKTDPIIPSSEDGIEMAYFDGTNANVTITLVATQDSTLPPIINAIEAFTVSSPLTNGTDSNDVAALSLLQQQFLKLQEWSGDPCLPASFNWEWVSCSPDKIPRITELHLSGLELVGSLPDFSSMNALQTIDLQNNSVDGEIPDFLGKFPNLKELNLAHNDFSGSIPSSLSNNKQIKLDVSGNPNLCVSSKSCQTSSTGTDTSSGTTINSSSGGKSSSKLPVILGAVIPIFVIFWAIVGVLIICHKRRKATLIGAQGAAVQMGGPGKPSGPTQAAPNGFFGQTHAANYTHNAVNDHRVEFVQEVVSEFVDSSQQQTPANNDNNNAEHPLMTS